MKKRLVLLVSVLILSLVPVTVRAELPPPPPPPPSAEEVTTAAETPDENPSTSEAEKKKMEFVKQEPEIKIKNSYYEAKRMESLKFSLGLTGVGYESAEAGFDFYDIQSAQYVSVKIKSDTNGKVYYNFTETSFGKKENLESPEASGFLQKVTGIESELYGIGGKKVSEMTGKTADDILTGKKNVSYEEKDGDKKIEYYGMRDNYMVGQSFGLPNTSQISMEKLRGKFEGEFGDINSASFTRSFFDKDRQETTFITYTDFDGDRETESYILTLYLHSDTDNEERIRLFMQDMPEAVKGSQDDVIKKSAEFIKNPEKEKVIEDDDYKIILESKPSVSSNTAVINTVRFYYTLDEKGELYK